MQRYSALLLRLFAVSFLALLLASPVAGEDAAPEAPATASSPASSLEERVEAMAKVGRATSPSFSPDGERLAFVTDLSGVPQVWAVDAAGGWPDQVTALDDQISGVAWSPTDDLLAFSLAPGGGMNQQIYLVRPDGTELRRITAGGTVNNWLGSWTDDGSSLTFSSNVAGPRAMDSYLYDLAAGEAEKVADNEGIGTLVDLSPDGSMATIWRMENRGESNVFLRHLESGEETLLTPHDGVATSSGGHFSDDRTVYLATNADRDRTALARVRLDEGKPGDLEYVATRDDAVLGAYELSHDGKTAVLAWNVAGRSELERMDLAGGERLPGPELPAEIVGALTFAPDDRRVALVLTGSTAPADLWIWDLETDDLRQITRSPHPGVDLDELVEPELVRFEAHDGLELSGWLYRPPGSEDPAEDGSGGRGEAPGPAVLSFHGGPEGQARPGFRADIQALAARGIAVLAPNVRGSSGFGKEFVNLDNAALRFDGVKDIESCWKYLVENGIADPERVGIMGGSYGGYMTMAGLAWYPELFAAGANLFGVVNFETFFEQTEPWMAAISKVEYGDPETQRDLLRRLSPIHAVDQVKAPTLVLHGANDTNVPVVEAEQVVDSLEARGVPVRYVLFPDEGHGFRKTKNRVTSTVAVVEWFAEHL